MSGTTAPGPVLRLGADDGARDLPGAERLLERVAAAVADLVGGDDPHPTWAGTHVVAGGRVAVAATWRLPPGGEVAPVAAALARDLDADLAVDLAADPAPDGPAPVATAARAALEQHRRRSSGRLVRFPGSAALAALTGPTTVAEVLATSAIDAVEALAGTTPAPGSALDLRGHVRPTWTARGCVLLVQRARECLVPFEVRDQKPCCAAH